MHTILKVGNCVRHFSLETMKKKKKRRRRRRRRRSRAKLWTPCKVRTLIFLEKEFGWTTSHVKYTEVFYRLKKKKKKSHRRFREMEKITLPLPTVFEFQMSMIILKFYLSCQFSLPFFFIFSLTPSHLDRKFF